MQSLQFGFTEAFAVLPLRSLQLPTFLAIVNYSLGSAAGVGALAGAGAGAGAVSGATTVTPPPHVPQSKGTGAKQGSKQGLQKPTRQRKIGQHGLQQTGGQTGWQAGTQTGGQTGTQTGGQTGTQHTGATSQQTGGGQQHALWRQPASEIDEKLARIATTAAIMATTLVFELKLIINPFLCKKKTGYKKRKSGRSTGGSSSCKWIIASASSGL